MTNESGEIPRTALPSQEAPDLSRPLDAAEIDLLRYLWVRADLNDQLGQAGIPAQTGSSSSLAHEIEFGIQRLRAERAADEPRSIASYIEEQEERIKRQEQRQTTNSEINKRLKTLEERIKTHLTIWSKTNPGKKSGDDTIGKGSHSPEGIRCNFSFSRDPSTSTVIPKSFEQVVTRESDNKTYDVVSKIFFGAQGHIIKVQVTASRLGTRELKKSNQTRKLGKALELVHEGFFTGMGAEPNSPSSRAIVLLEFNPQNTGIPSIKYKTADHGLLIPTWCTIIESDFREADNTIIQQGFGRISLDPLSLADYSDLVGEILGLFPDPF